MRTGAPGDRYQTETDISQRQISASDRYQPEADKSLRQKLSRGRLTGRESNSRQIRNGNTESGRDKYQPQQETHRETETENSQRQGNAGMGGDKKPDTVLITARGTV